MAIHTYGPNAVDWEQRVDLGRLRDERLARLKANGTVDKILGKWGLSAKGA